MFGKSTSTFDRLLEKATSQLLLEPDWDSILQICDQIRQGDVQGKYAVAATKRKINQENPHVSLFGLQVLESCVKNCGGIIHDEIATKDFMEYFKDLVKKRPDPVKAKILELIQVWSHAFRNEPGYKVVQDTFNLMKMEGYSFPTLKESDAMFSAEKAPEWKDSECCNRCRVQFSTFQRKHHCRACGDIFCQKCSSKTSIIPKFGIEKEVRVCEACYDQINKGGAAAPKKEGEDDLPAEYLSSSLAQQSQQTPAQKSEQEIQEEEELQLALAISMSEAQAKEKERSRLRNNYGGNYGSSNTTSSSTDSPVYAQPAKVSAPVLDTSDMDPELARYLNRNYWEQRQDDGKAGSGGVAPSTTQPSAPVAVAEPTMSNSNTTSSPVMRVQEKYQNGETDDEEQFLNALRGSIEIFVNRMKSNSQRGRSIANDSSVQSLFMTLNAMHPQLMKYVQGQEDMRAHYESLQDKLAQLKDARDALDSLREEHREKRRIEQEELERQRQIQMAHKLEILRQKKQEYLEYQRQLALQRMREQEIEMQRRLEQQKQMQQMKAMHYAYPQMYQPGPTFSPGGSAEGSPLHQAHPPPGPQGPYPPPGQPGMGMPPGAAPGAPGPQMQPQMGGPQMGGPPTATMAGQPVYNPAMPGQMSQAPGGLPMGPGPVPPPGGYQQQPPGGYQPQGGYPPNTQPASMPPGQPQPGYAPGQPGMAYSSFNMQGMAGALPPGQGQGQPPIQQPPPQGLPGQQYGAPPPGQFAPPPQEQQQQQQQPQQQQQQPPPPQGQPYDTAQLISFD